jgi:large subunit ribosomal protein L46
MQRTLLRRFFGQHTTPVVPQVAAPYDGPLRISVGYLLYRNQVVKHDPHPLEQEMAFLLDREHQRYSRHDAESATHFFASRGLSVDTWGRVDPKAINDDFFALDAYQDAVTATTQRWAPTKRLCAADFADPFAAGAAPPARHTLNRALHDFLYLIVQDAASGKWTVPAAPRQERESLRTTLSRALAEHHGGALDTYTFSNSPQCVLQPPAPLDGAAPAADREQLYIYNTVYLAGRPAFDRLAPACADHAWVTRAELPQYDFADDRLLAMLRDVTMDATFDATTSD